MTAFPTDLLAPTANVNIAVPSVPEPATLTIASLAGAMLLRRRRRS